MPSLIQKSWINNDKKSANAFLSLYFTSLRRKSNQIFIFKTLTVGPKHSGNFNKNPARNS